MSPAANSSSIRPAVPEALIALYRLTYAHDPSAVVTLRADGSNRRIYRLLTDDLSVVGVHGPDPLENRAFLAYSRAFRSIGLHVPEIYATNEEAGVYLEEDLGDVTLLAALEAARNGGDIPGEILSLYQNALTDLVRFQIDGAGVVDFSIGYPTAEFGEREIRWDLNYFKYDFLRLTGIPFNEARLEADFDSLVALLLSAPSGYFMYRDFQPRNIMIRNGEPWYLDYQGGRRGALQYDLASILYSSKAALSPSNRAELLEWYLSALEERMPVDRGRFLREFKGFRLVRMLQILGAYGFRGLFERKSHFIESIPFAQANLRDLLESDGLPEGQTELRSALERIAEAELVPRATSAGAPGKLTVHISSFSYRQGYPVDSTGHGGGFVFDCRALHNPGRYDQYKSFCGLDEPVRRFLGREQSVSDFHDAVRHLVGPAIETYRTRGFEHLSVAFGCTGGQHRSVYVAELLARWVRETWPDVNVEVIHRESSRWPASPRSAGEQQWTL